MIDLGGYLLVLDAVVEAAHLTHRPVPLFDEGVDLRIAGTFRRFLLLGLLLFVLLRLSGHLIHLIGEESLPHDEGRRRQWEQQRIGQPDRTHQIDGDHRPLYMFCHI